MKSSQLMVQCLENEGVKLIFGLPGEEILDLMDSLADSPIRFIGTRHEQGAAFMADVHGRLTGKAGVCLSTLGPGATNLVTGVADAQMDHAPLVAITGQASLDRVHKESHQVLNIVEAFHPLTKWNTQVKQAQTIPETVRKAFKLAETEKPGATHIELPENLAHVEVEGEPLRPTPPFPTEPRQDRIEVAAHIISEARFPVIMAGNGVARMRASNCLRSFCEKLNIPVATTFMGKGTFPDSHPLSLHTIGLQASDYVSCGLERADVVIAVGYDLVEYDPKLWNPEGDKKIVHIDASPAEVDASYTVNVGVLGDISSSLGRISSIAKPCQSTYTATLREFIQTELSDNQTDSSFPIKPQRALADLREVLDPEDIVISDVGAHKLWIARLFACEKPNTCIISNGFASMGIAVPGAIAAKLLAPDKNIVAVAGDAGFLMNVQELETAVRENTPFVTLIFEDRGYGLITWKQSNRFGRTYGTTFGNPDFVKLAESFGAKGYRVEAADELKQVLREAISQKVPAVIDCPVDYSENLKLTEKLGRLTCPI